MRCARRQMFLQFGRLRKHTTMPHDPALGVKPTITVTDTA